MKQRIVLVDIDGTLFAGMNSEAAFILYLFRCGKLGVRQLLHACWFYTRWWPRYRRHVAKKNKAYLTGLEISTVANLAASFVTNELVPRLRPVMLRRLDMHRQAGDFVALLSGTPTFIAEPLARALLADGWCATRCAVSAGRFTAAPPDAHPFGKEKLQRAAELCASRGFSLAHAIAYADSGYDLPLLSYVARPVAVYPDRTLKRVAETEGWEIIDAARGSALNTAVEI